MESDVVGGRTMNHIWKNQGPGSKNIDRSIEFQISESPEDMP